MAITYDQLRDRIGDKLGYGVSSTSWSANSTKSLRVERILADGLRRFFDPPVTPSHQWTFLTKIGSLTTASGVYSYVLPSDFSMLEEAPTYAPNDETLWPPFNVTGAELLRYRLQQDSTSGRPLECAVQVASVTEAVGTRYELLVWPVPDDEYVIQLPYKINPTIPGADESVPLGGQPHERTVIAACMAECEVFDEFSDGKAEGLFQAALAASIAHDHRSVMPFNLGVNGDNSDLVGHRAEGRQYMQNMYVSYNGLSPGQL